MIKLVTLWRVSQRPMRAVLSYVRVSLSTRIVIFPNADIKFHIIVTMKTFSSNFYRLLATICQTLFFNFIMNSTGWSTGFYSRYKSLSWALHPDFSSCLYINWVRWGSFFLGGGVVWLWSWSAHLLMPNSRICGALISRPLISSWRSGWGQARRLTYLLTLFHFL